MRQGDMETKQKKTFWKGYHKEKARLAYYRMLDEKYQEKEQGK